MTASAAQPRRRPWYRPSLTVQIMIGLVVGGVIGWLRPDWGNAVYFLRDIFINLIKSIIAPLVFSTIVVGIAGAGALRKVGRMGIKALIYFEIVTTAALVIGLAVVNFTKPGVGVTLAATSTDVLKTIGQTHPQTFVETIVHVFPASIIEAMVRGDVLQIVAFSVLFALAVSAVGEKGKPIIRAMDSLSQVMFKFTNYVMLFAPIGVGAAMAHTIGTQGPVVLLNLGKLIGSLYLALVIFIALIFGLVIRVARVPLRQFVRAVREPAALAFATTSSESALPKAMESMERFGVPPHIVGFVMPTGYSFNLTGSTLYLAMASIFVAQAAETTMGWHMSLGQQITMMLTLMLTSKGVAGVPRASLVILLGALNSFIPAGLGPIGVAIIFGVDELMDMGRTCVNVIGNCLATVVVARWEGEFDEGRARVFGTPAEAELYLKTGEYDISLNAVAVQLNGTPLATIAAAPMVERAEYNALYHPTLSESYKIINALGAWGGQAGRPHAGGGIKIGDIDTGIDNIHPFFDPTGFSYPTEGGPWPKCDAVDSNSHHQDQDCKYVSPKVIVAKVFYNKNNQQNFDAQAIQDHGTHTAGIAAGVTGKTAVSNGVMIDDMSGIAPGAWLGNYNVFPGDVLNARNEDILNAVDAAIEDGMDVLNLSLGGSYHGNNDLLAIGLDNAVDAGVVVAVAAGNSGPGQGTLESPGRARKVITVAASTNQHFVGQPFTYPASGGTTIGAAVGDFDPLPAMSFGLFDAGSDGCTSVPGGASGNVAIIDRGTCSFSQKVANAKAAGAIGVVIVNNVAGDPIAMARTAGFDDALSAVMISKNDGAALRAANPPDASASATFQEFVTPENKDILAGFSGQGPTNVDFAVKPDVTSVGVNVLSSITCVNKPAGCPDNGTGWAFFQGTSMSTPHIAGSAAVLLQLHPDWLPGQVKSALVNRADLVIKDAITGTHDVAPTAQGAGRENLSVAADGTTWMDPASASFGRVALGHPTSVTITLSNPTGTAETFSVSVTKFTPDTFGGTVPSIYDAGTLSAGDTRISVPGSVNVPANGSAVLTVTVNNGIPSGEVVQGWINLDGPGSSDLHFAYYAIVGH